MVTSRLAAFLASLLLWCAVGSQAQPLAPVTAPAPSIVAAAGLAAPGVPGDGPVFCHPLADVSTSGGAETASDVPVDLGDPNAVPEPPFTLRAPCGAAGPSHASPCLDGPRRPPR